MLLHYFTAYAQAQVCKVLAARTQVQVCNPVVMQPARKCGFASRFLAVYTQCRLAASLLCSPHACAGLHLRCPAAHTQAQVCNLVIMLSTRKCGFASVLPCIPHASAGSQACRHAAHKQVRACTHVVLQPTRMCRCATSCHAAHTQVRVCTCVAPCSSHVGAGGQPDGLAAHMQCRFASLLSCMRVHVTMPKHL